MGVLRLRPGEGRSEGVNYQSSFYYGSTDLIQEIDALFRIGVRIVDAPYIHISLSAAVDIYGREGNHRGMSGCGM
jgi:hypothetical protein